MSYAEEIRPAVREPAGDYDAVMDFRRDVEASRITGEQRAQLQAMTRNILRQNAARDLSPVFDEPSAAPVAPAVTTCAAIDEYLSTLTYGIPAGIGRMAAELAELEARVARRTAEALRLAAGSTGRAA